MISNEYIGLLPEDYTLIQHPVTKKNVKLFRIIAMKSFRLLDSTIKFNQIGGYVESIDNLTGPCWVEPYAKVFDSARIDNSYIKNRSLIFGSSKITNSIILDSVRVHENPEIYDSSINGVCVIKGSAKIFNSKIEDSCIITQNCKIHDSKVSGGVVVDGEANVTSSVLSDVAQVGGTAKLENCNLSGHSTLKTDSHVDVRLNVPMELSFETFEGTPEDVQYVNFKYNNQRYKGYAAIIPGKTKALLFREAALKNLVTTSTGMNISITAEELVKRKKF